MKQPKFTATQLKAVDILSDSATIKKEQIAIRLDTDVLKTFRQTGRGWQSRINAVLRVYIAANK